MVCKGKENGREKKKGGLCGKEEREGERKGMVV